MIRYTVVWNPSALDELAEIWMATPDRNAVSFATNEIDRELGIDATERGDELHEGLRVRRAAQSDLLCTREQPPGGNNERAQRIMGQPPWHFGREVFTTETQRTQRQHLLPHCVLCVSVVNAFRSV